MIKNLIFLFCLIIIISSCKSDRNNDYKSEFIIPDSVLYEGVLEVSQEAMDEIIHNISSPVEMAALIKALGVPFSKEYLATTDYVDDYNTSFKQAYNLGTFGADLGYLNMYNKTTAVIDYISAIKKLADGINVGQFFNFSTLKRLATSSKNLDSLMYISIRSFNRMDSYLHENNRSNLSALIVAGVWVEGLYITTQVAKENPHPDIAERIGEQKLILNNLLLILKNYKKDKKFASLIKILEELKDEFADVKITYIPGEPEAIEEDGMLTIIQNETSMVEMTDKQLENIINKTEKIRNQLIRL